MFNLASTVLLVALMSSVAPQAHTTPNRPSPGLNAVFDVLATAVSEEEPEWKETSREKYAGPDNKVEGTWFANDQFLVVELLDYTTAKSCSAKFKESLEFDRHPAPYMPVAVGPPQPIASLGDAAYQLDFGTRSILYVQVGQYLILMKVGMQPTSIDLKHPESALQSATYRKVEPTSREYPANAVRRIGVAVSNAMKAR